MDAQKSDDKDMNQENPGRPATVLVGVGFIGAILALVTASCCVLPMALMVLGLGGVGLSIFSPAAAASVYILPLALLCIAAAWILVLARPERRRTLVFLVVASVLVVLAGAIYLFQTQITTFLISLM